MIILQPILPTAAVCAFCSRTELNIDSIESQIRQLQQSDHLSPQKCNILQVNEEVSTFQQKSGIYSNNNENSQYNFTNNFTNKNDITINYNSKAPVNIANNDLMECSICWKIMHVQCMKVKLLEISILKKQQAAETTQLATHPKTDTQTSILNKHSLQPTTTQPSQQHPTQPLPQQAKVWESVINSDVPNSWECPMCCQAGKTTNKKVTFYIMGVLYH